MSNTPTAILTRREVFSASHRLHSKSLSDDENRALFGKCWHPNGHGHNYVLEVSVRGPIDEHGLVMNLTELKKILQKNVISKVDHIHLNMDVKEFKELNPTAENIAYVIWHWLKPTLGELLYEVKLHETENNVAIYRGE
ncbi:MAG: 6-carboxytetrahydropterin synthase [Rickettsiales bacterium]